ncbi:MAG: PIN domain-containing protein [Tenuifilaceae bacterium]|jgi:predicted nucleic acid-binding protein|nr:PIN domain-containing protein [Bacteroidales bacterium]MDI9516944.1 PIN domain-containing protein [Bacteroidota bacterium]NLH57182.1 PIN domain-containing protein [Rikenellaceae bacterium]OQC63124.1 MAG: PIN domain protein [Bacteroidetes bacterium ADurb.Bin008]HNV82527.1 PIN domain-containing protein [Tenuifilaceae bacterium]
MKKVFIDTNIIVDLLAKREPFYEEAAMLFTLADKQQVNLSVSALTFANTNYILSQSLKPEEVRQILRKLKLIVQVLCINEKIIGLSLNDNDFRDFEDAVQYYTALENDTDIIITRNLKDFQKAKLPVMTAAQFLTTI